MKVIDGGQGEGGGQVVRTALSLAAALRTPVRIENIRAGRPSPGLKHQHLAGARAIAQLTQGTLEGDDLGSSTLTFRPGLLMGGEYHFPIETAGSITLLLQTLLPALAASRQQFSLELEGGTDVPFAPTWYYFTQVHVPTLQEMGLVIETELRAHGYFPAGGGRARVTVDASGFHEPRFPERARPKRIRGVSHSNGLPKHIIQRAAEAAHDELLAGGYGSDIDLEHHRGPGGGMGISLWTMEGTGFPHRLGADAVGQRGRPAEEVGRRAARALLADLAAGSDVDAHQADMLPPFLALAGGGAYTVRGLTRHLETTLRVVEAMTGIPCRTEEAPKGVRVRVGR